ncbi:MAG: glycosyltransferase [Chloroflexi bacterium]|nr:glycosyltransferase [Chloroflexota bacterium]
MKSKEIPYLQLSTNFCPQNIYPGIPESVSQKYGVVPLWMGHENYVVGVADRQFRYKTSIERLIEHPIKLFLLPYSTIQYLQYLLYGDHYRLNIQKGVSELYHCLNGNPANRDEMNSRDHVEKNHVNEKLLRHNLTFTEKANLECLGIDYQIPHFDLNATRIDTALAPLIPLETARRYHVIPLWWLGKCLFIGCNSATISEDFPHLEELFPFNYQLILCTERQWKLAFRSIYLEGQKEKTISEQDLIIYYQRHFSLDAGNLQRAKIYSNQYKTDLTHALLELKIISPAMALQARSVLMGVPRVELIQKSPSESAKLLPVEIAELLDVVILEQNGKTISVAGDEITREKIDVVHSITGYEVKPYLVDSDHLQIWLKQIRSMQTNETITGYELSLREILSSLGMLTEKQMNEVEKESADDDVSFSKRLLALGYLSDADLAMLFSLQTGTPSAVLDHANLKQDYLNEYSQEFVQKHSLIPLYESETAIWVATTDPFNGDGFQQIEQSRNKPVIPIIAPTGVVEAIIEQTWGAHKPVIIGDAYPFIQKLIRFDFLTQTQANEMIRLIKEERQSFDEAFMNATFFDARQTNRILANVFSIPILDISLVEELREQFDGLGNKTTRPFYSDPIDPKIATLVDNVFASEHTMLPIRKEEQHVLVAFADPMTVQNLKFFEDHLGVPISPVLAIRSDLKDAISRSLGRKNIGTYLMENGYISRRQLNDALELSQRTGVRLGQALLTKQYVREVQIYEVLAKQTGFEFIDLKNTEIQEEAVRLIDPDIERELGILPIQVNGSELTLAIVDPIDRRNIAKAEELTKKKAHPVIVSEEGFEFALEHIYKSDYTTTSTSNLLKRSPRESAFRVLSKGQAIFFSVVFFLSLIWMILDFTSFAIIINELVTIFYIGFSGYKFYLVYNAMNHDCEVPVSKAELDALDPVQLPIYTLLVPVYKEAEVLPDLMKSLTQLDYPNTKLDIKILLEEDDIETIQRFYDLDLPPHFKATIVPGSQPKTKPKACNYGLIHAKGEYIVIFDAEDRPDHDQLKKAVVAFEKSDSNVVCIQAKLNYYNRTQNLLTQWFTSEYSMWFDLFLPGLDASEAPIPLGGTSNHFKRRALAEVGAWDPHNVTEDADLGMRLYKRGYHTRTIDSTTYEEANSRVNNWLRQRSRWIKGYIQTWLVHMRDPLKLAREVGIKGFISFQFVTGGTFFAALANPILWTITTVWFLTQWAFIQETFPGMIFYLSSLSLYLGNFVFTYMNVAGAMRRKHYDNVRYALLSPVYWGLMSIGAWKGFLQLITKPHYWEKTIHGYSEEKGFNLEEEIIKEEENAS